MTFIQVFNGFNFSEPILSAPNWANIGLGYNFGIGNSSGGFSNFWYPNFNYDSPVQNAENAIAGAHEKASAQWANNLGLTASLDGTGMPSGQMGTFDANKAIINLTLNLHDISQGGCVNRMVPALIEGGIVGLKGQPIKAARLYGPILKGFGFVTIDRTNGVYQRGDIAVFQGYTRGTANSDGVPYGHIQVFDGEHWLSVFKQNRPFWPGSKYELYKPSYEILRWPNE